jgi:hypothetical protein
MQRELLPCIVMMGLLVGLLLAGVFSLSERVWAEGSGAQAFHTVVTDVGGVDTDVSNLIFYWEEKVSETAFVPHEIREMPVKRGTATVKIKFGGIKQIDIKPAASGVLPTVTISLGSGKAGEFLLATDGIFKGQSEFGEFELPATQIKKIVFK